MEKYTTENLLKYVKEVNNYWDTSHSSRRLKFYLAVEELENRGLTWETIENYMDKGE